MIRLLDEPCDHNWTGKPCLEGIVRHQHLQDDDLLSRQSTRGGSRSPMSSPREVTGGWEVKTQREEMSCSRGGSILGRSSSLAGELFPREVMIELAAELQEVVREGEGPEQVNERLRAELWEQRARNFDLERLIVSVCMPPPAL